MMHRKAILCVVLLSPFVARLVSSQNFGPGLCLLTRLEVFPCDTNINDDPNSTPDPDSNEYAIYQTGLIRGSAGLPVCVRNAPTEEDPFPIRRIESIGLRDQVKFLVSPGIELEPPQDYGDQQLVIYNVECPDNHIAYFNLTLSDIEAPTCSGCPASPAQCCSDYLEVVRGQFGRTESCGNDTASNTNQLEQRTFTATFRSSFAVHQSGFKATVTCLLVGEEEPDDCTVPDEDGLPMVRMTDESDDENRRRRKRDLEDFHKEWHMHITYLKRLKRQSPNFMLRFEEISVAHTTNVTFADKVLKFIDIRSGEEIRSIEDILFLHTFDANGDVDEFREEGVNAVGDLILFPGPGPMFVVGRHAYFQLFVIDPRGILPNDNETVVINQLAEGQFDALVLEDTILSDDFLFPPMPDPVSIGLRGRRQAPNEGVSYSDDILQMAINFEEACNPILRTNSIAIIESANPDDVARLRGTGSGSGSDMVTPI